MTTPRVLVLLATYRGRPFVDQQIASIVWQVGVVAHVLARDDGSTDGTVDACKQWALRDPDAFSLVQDEERTGSAAGNFFRLLAAAPLDDYDYVAFADQDDIWFPDKLARAIDLMREDGADGYSSGLLAFDQAKGSAWTMRKDGSEADLDYLFQTASAGCTYVLSAKAAGHVRDVIGSVSKAWPRGLSHDWTIYAICRSHGFRWVRDAYASILYRQHGGNEWGARAGLGGLLQRFHLVRDDWYRSHVLWLRNVVAMTPAERAVFNAIERGDRLWLARNAGRFRRTAREARLLAASFVTGLF